MTEEGDVLSSPDDSAQTSTNQALFVIGMHRSGTSALTRVLSLTGAALPRDLMEPGPHNPTGHWESMPIADCNDRILEALGIRWHTPFPRARTGAGGSSLAKFENTASELFQQQFGDRPLIVFKEPRATILADFWCAVLRKQNYTPRIIIMVRDPDEVAVSLTKRDGFAHAHGLLLWANYMAEAELLSRGMSRTFCFYDELLTDPQGLLDRIEAGLGITLPSRAAAASDVEAFLLTNAPRGRTLPVYDRNRFEPVWKLAAQLRTLAAGRRSEEDVSAQMMAWLEDMRGMFGPILEAYDAFIDAERQRVHRAELMKLHLYRSLGELRPVLHELDAQVDALQSLIARTSPSTPAVVLDESKFDPASYLTKNPDLVDCGIGAWDHFDRFGRAEGRSF